MKRSRARRRIYINPLFDVDVFLERDGKAQRFTTWANNESCRESIINAIWNDILEGNAELTAEGRGKLIIRADISLPLTDDEDELVPADLKAVSRLRQLTTTPSEQTKLIELAQLTTWIPAVLYSGPAAIAAGSVRPSSRIQKRRFSYYGADLTLTLRHLTNTVLQHPALLSIVLAQIRWAMEEYARGRYARLNRQLQIKRSRARLHRIAQQPKLHLRDRVWLQRKLSELIAASNTTSTLSHLSRYPVSPRFGHELRKFFRQEKAGSLYHTWLNAKGNGPYKGMDQYGFYKWVKRTIPQAKSKLEKLARSEYATHHAYFINNDE